MYFLYYHYSRHEMKEKVVGPLIRFQFGKVAPTLFAKVFTLHPLRRPLPAMGIVRLPTVQ